MVLFQRLGETERKSQWSTCGPLTGRWEQMNLSNLPGWPEVRQSRPAKNSPVNQVCSLGLESAYDIYRLSGTAAASMSSTFLDCIFPVFSSSDSSSSPAFTLTVPPENPPHLPSNRSRPHLHIPAISNFHFRRIIRETAVVRIASISKKKWKGGLPIPYIPTGRLGLSR